jgi:hypothetical protein
VAEESPLRRVLALALAASSVMACAGGTGSEPKDEAEGELAWPSTTKVSDSASSAALSSFDVDTGELRFSKETPLLASLDVGDVLAGDVSEAAPYGFLRRIRAIRREDGALVLDTEQASLDQALTRADLAMHALTPALEELVASGGTEASARSPSLLGRAELGYGVSKQALGLDFGNGLSLPAVDVREELCPGSCANGSVVVSGQVAASLGYELGIGIRPHLSLEDVFDGTVGVTAYMNANAGVNGQARIRAVSTFTGSITAEREVANVKNVYHTSAFGFPVVVVAIGTLSVGVTGEAESALESAAHGGVSCRVGAAWTSDHGWEDLNKPELSFGFDPPSVRANAKLHTYSRAKLQVLLYGLAGFESEARFGTELDAASPRDPAWLLRARADAHFDLSAGIPVLSQALSREKTLFDESFELGRSQNQSPVIASAPGDGVWNASRPFALVLNGAPSLDGAYLVVSAHDREDGDAITLSVSSDLDGPLALDAAGEGPKLSQGIHTLTLTLTDSVGAVSTRSFVLNVRQQRPVLQVRALPSTVQSRVDVLLHAVALDPEATDATRNAIPCAELTWSVTAPDLLFAGGRSGTSVSGCDVTARFLETGSRNVTVTATHPVGVSSTETHAIAVTPPPDVLPPSIDGYALRCDNAEPLQSNVLIDGVISNVRMCPSRASVLSLDVSATDPAGLPLSYSLTMENLAGDPASRVPLNVSAFGAPTAAASYLIPERRGLAQINPDWCTDYHAGFGARLVLTVSNGTSTTTRSEDIFCPTPGAN